MKRWKLLGDAEQAGRNRIALQGGSYSIIITAVVLAILTRPALLPEGTGGITLPPAGQSGGSGEEKERCCCVTGCKNDTCAQ